jgi:hypothetical protein
MGSKQNRCDAQNNLCWRITPTSITYGLTPELLFQANKTLFEGEEGRLGARSQTKF